MTGMLTECFFLFFIQVSTWRIPFGNLHGSILADIRLNKKTTIYHVIIDYDILANHMISYAIYLFIYFNYISSRAAKVVAK